jgi:uncharacterized membrane protein
MAKQTKTITVNAPVEKVFSYVDEATNLPKIWPSLVEVKDVKRLPNGGHSDKWVYKMAGILLKGSSEDIEHIPNQRIVTKTKGGADSTQTWLFQPEAGGTKVTFEVEYTVPIKVLGKLAEAIIVKMNEHEGDTLLANLKAIMEASTPTPA